MAVQHAFWVIVDGRDADGVPIARSARICCRRCTNCSARSRTSRCSGSSAAGSGSRRRPRARRCWQSCRGSPVAGRDWRPGGRTWIRAPSTRSRATKSARGSRSASAGPPSESRSDEPIDSRPRPAAREPPSRDLAVRRVTGGRSPAARRVDRWRKPAVHRAIVGRSPAVRHPAIVGKNPAARRRAIAGRNRSRSVSVRSGPMAIVPIDHRRSPGRRRSARSAFKRERQRFEARLATRQAFGIAGSPRRLDRRDDRPLVLFNANHKRPRFN